ncbi:hypothetical protein AVEN_234425-1 [Araneus ventricosus]|uniref:Uncharacterized protein n=1 Tax=Araneus ventricosus TaxID=182803 RepID=A0A4Y2A9B4_ARAVE|nr:hypothetical protein AVEN_234425-1 [Araneus ventricosus]
MRGDPGRHLAGITDRLIVDSTGDKFRADYTSTDEHVCYIWAPVRPSSSTPVLPSDSCIPEEEQNDSQASSCLATSLRQHQGPWYRVVFADQTLLIPGRYRLFYISSEFDDILGVSEPFEIHEQV